MKKIFSLLFSLLAITLAFTPAVTVVSHALDYSPVLTIIGVSLFAVIIAYSPAIKMPFIYKNGVEVEVWQKYIADNLFRGWEWLKNSFRADEYVLQGKVVHIPQAGAKPTVIKNPTSFPMVAVTRADTDVNYALDQYSTIPTRISEAEKIQLSYDKMESVLGDHIGVLNDASGENISIKWCPTTAGHILRTTGSAYAAHTPAATGTRKGLTTDDLKRASTALTKQKVSKQDRYAVMSEDMWNQLEDQLKASNNKDYSRYVDAENGVIAKLYTFNIITVPSMPVYNNAGTPAPKAWGAAGATTDNEAVLCYQKNALELALGEIRFYENIGDATYQGDIYSGLVFMGGRIRYADETGVMAIVQES